MLRWLSNVLGARSSEARSRVEEFTIRADQLHQSGDLAAAERLYRQALESEPDHLPALVNLAAVLLARGMPAAAEQRSRQALRLAPATLAAHVNLGSALQAQGDLAGAAASYRAALALETQCAPALANLSSVCLKREEYPEARRFAERALELDPDLVQAHLNLGVVHETRGELEAALRRYESALALDPACIQAHLNRASIWLTLENYAAGWEEYEWRLRAPENAALHAQHPLTRWDGSALARRGILVYGEQGLGDQIMYASCLPELIAQAGRCVIDCDPRLEPLFRRSFPQAIVGAHAAESADVKLPLASLPLYLRRSVDDFPQHRGYLRADPGRVHHWRSRLEALGPAMKIGLSWRGGVPQTGQARRSIELRQLDPLLDQRDAIFVNLQYGDSGERGAKLVHWPEALEHYDETAALVCALDLTISVCTALVHLAGALGRPVWVLAPVKPEARYGYAGESMRWYPSVRMFRQPAYGDWESVLARVARQLQLWRSS